METAVPWLSRASVVSDLKIQLEERGEYVVMANISSGWFAINPRTWRIRSEQATRDGRDGPNLIVYRTTSGDIARDATVRGSPCLRREHAVAP